MAAQTHAKVAPSTLKAALWMCASIASFLTMTVAARALVTNYIDAFQVMLMRSVIGWFMLLPLVLATGGFASMRTSHPVQHIARNALHYAGQYAWMLALGMIPLAQLISIEFTTPIWGSLGAVLLLGERMSLGKGVALLFGLIGVLVIVQPGVSTVQPGHLIMLAGAIGFGLSVVLVKSLTRTDSTTVIIFWMLIIQSIIGLVPAIMVWRTPPAELWPWIALVSFTGMSSHFFMARALSYADATVVMPMDFLRLPISAVIGYLLYAETIDIYTAAGALLILFGNLFNLRRKAKEPEVATS